MNKNNEYGKINPGILNEKKLLDELAHDIAFKFGLDKEKTKKLIESDVIQGIKDLRNEIDLGRGSHSEKIKLGKQELEELFFMIKGAKEVIEKGSKIEIQTLKNDIENNINIDEFKQKIEEFLPKSILEKAKDPKNMSDQVLGLALGTANSIYATVDMLYQIGKGILQTPYHLYLIITGKGESKSFKQ